jgi:hypothetical protein
VAVVASLRQAPCAAPSVVDLSATVPEPGCFCFGGMAYSSTVRTLLLNVSDGEAEFRDDVFVSVHTTRSVEEPVNSWRPDVNALAGG